MMFIKRMIAFVKRNFLIWKSYKLMFILEWGGLFTTTLTFYFISKLVGKIISPYMADYGTEYFPFVIIGIAFSAYLHTALASFAYNLRTEQMTGTLEMLLLAPIRTREIIIGTSLWDFIFASTRVIGYLAIGVIFLGIDVNNINFISSIVVLALSIICFSRLGVITGAIIMLFKRGEPVTWFITTFASFFGGAYFPIEVLPAPLRLVSYLLPVTYALRAFRYAALKGYSLMGIRDDLLILFIYAVILFPLSIIIFKLSLKWAKIKGSLSHY